MASLQAGEVTTSTSVVERLTGDSEGGESMMEKAVKDIAFGSVRSSRNLVDLGSH
jgi:hypothetical protein